jgi:myo-inositol-1(or 4)-monophosphatase
MEERLAFVKHIAAKAGEILIEGYAKQLHPELKGEIDLVTEYDLRSEKLLIESVRQNFPNEAILAEEGGSSGKGETCWIIDPLDGTTNFTHGIPIFTISIAWGIDMQPQLGVVYDPIRNEMFHAVKEGGAWLNDHPIQVSGQDELNSSLLVTGFSYDIRENPDNNLNHFFDLSLRSRGVRRLGSAALDLAYIAAGRFDGYWELRLWPWDWAAGALLVREAGGLVTRAEGSGDIFEEPRSILATNGHIHQQMLEVLGRQSAHQ